MHRSSLIEVGDFRAEDAEARQTQLAAALVPLERAENGLGRPWLAPIRPLPVVGTQLRSVDALVTAALGAARSADALLSEIDPIRVGLADGSMTFSEAVRRLQPHAQAAHQAFSADLGPRRGLLPQLANARDQLAEPMSRGEQRLDDLTVILGGLDRLLQGSQYLLLVSNPSEMRIGSGMFLQAGVVTIDPDGQLAVSELASVSDLPPAPAAVPITDPDTSRHWSWLLPTELYQNVAVSPRFEVVADMAARMWEANHTEPIEGVLSVDPSALAAIVSLTGPVTLNDGRQLAAGDIARFAASDQYAIAENDEERHRLLGELAATVVNSLATVSPTPEQLLDALRAPVQARQLKLWAREPVVQQAWARLGASATMTGSDVLVSVSNYNANKLDYLLGIQARLSPIPVGPTNPATVRRELAVTITNRATGQEPTEVLGELDPGRYFGILTTHLPQGATDLTINDEPVPAKGTAASPPANAILGRTPARLVLHGPDGPNELLGVSVGAAPGETSTVRIGFTLPADRPVRIIPSGRFPGIEWADMPGAEGAPVILPGVAAAKLSTTGPASDGG